MKKSIHLNEKQFKDLIRECVESMMNEHSQPFEIDWENSILDPFRSRYYNPERFGGRDMIKITDKPSAQNVDPETLWQDKENAIKRHFQRQNARWEDEDNEKERSERYNDPEYREKGREYWEKRRSEMGEPHGYGTSGTLTIPGFHDETDKGRAVNETIASFFKGEHFDGNNPMHNKLRSSFNSWYNTYGKSFNLPESVVVDMLQSAIEDIEYGEI